MQNDDNHLNDNLGLKKINYALKHKHAQALTYLILTGRFNNKDISIIVDSKFMNNIKKSAKNGDISSAAMIGLFLLGKTDAFKIRSKFSYDEIIQIVQQFANKQYPVMNLAMSFLFFDPTSMGFEKEENHIEGVRWLLKAEEDGFDISEFTSSIDKPDYP